MAYSQAWLEDPSSNRDLFVEVVVYDVVAVAETTLYLSTTGYLTSDAITSYNPILSRGVQFTESLSVDGGTSLSYGDLEINNPTGSLDDWLDPAKYIWVNRSIKIYLGDPLWVTANLAAIHSTFQLVFDGVVADIDSSAKNTLNIKIRDKLERLNCPLTESKLGTYGTWSPVQTNQDEIKPLVFGEVFNIPPILIDPAQLEYMFNDGNAEGIIEIRDNALPIYTRGGTTYGATVTNTTGTFKLTNSLAGALTCSVQGVKNSMNLTTGALVSGTYSNNIANLIALITTQYGKSTTRLDGTTELDLNNLAIFEAANTQAVGVLVTGSENVISVCQAIASSIGAQIFINRLGQLQLLRLGVYTTDTAVTITDSDIVLDSLLISSRIPVITATKLGYCYNHTAQDGLLTSIPDAHKDIFSTKNQWITVTITDGTGIKTKYKLTEDPPQKDTALLIDTEAITEATRLNNYFKVPKTVYKFTGFAKLLSLKLGQEVVLTHNRFGLSSGKHGQVIGLSPDWTNGTVEVEVII